MNKEEINSLLTYFKTQGEVEFIETHISWVFLTDEYAFKFKKPARYCFLNYSNLIRRKFYCELEVELNSRYSDIYLDVIPVYRSGASLQLIEGEEIADYGVKMKKINPDFQMDHMIENDLVTSNEIHQLAKAITRFHKQAAVIKTPFSFGDQHHKFNDIIMVKSSLGSAMDTLMDQQINRAILANNCYLSNNTALFQRRIKQGFVRDVHGDLHTRNIFLLKEPILFDCIEFDDSLRQIDVLNEIAFLCMDLEASGRMDLSQEFLNTYLSIFPAIQNMEDERLFVYYKAYRANVRAKVYASRVKQTQDPKERAVLLTQVHKYLNLMSNYILKFDQRGSVKAFPTVDERNHLLV